jgi:hypothetical protein
MHPWMSAFSTKQTFWDLWVMSAFGSKQKQCGGTDSPNGPATRPMADSGVIRERHQIILRGGRESTLCWLCSA